MNDLKKIQDYRDLVAWQKAHMLTLYTYKLTKSFPKDELFGLTSQMRRAASSIGANIAEGFGRFSHKDREHFYVMAQGSAYELDNHLQLAYDLSYISEIDFEPAKQQASDTIKLLAALLRVHRSKA